MPTFGGTYSTGTVSVEQGSAAVTGSGVVWADVIEGDWLYANGVVGIIDTVDQDTLDALTLKKPWAGETAEDASYVILKNSWLRYEPALTQQKLRELLLRLTAIGFFYFVEGDEPAPEEIGEDGSFALKVNDSELGWRLWIKIDGEWVEQGTPVGLNFRTDVADGFWAMSTPYFLRDLVRHEGKLWYAVRSNLGVEPGTSLADWVLFYPFPNEAGVSIILDGYGSEMVSGPARDLPITFKCRLKKIQLEANGVGNFTLDIWKRVRADGKPREEDSITASSPPTISGSDAYEDSVLEDWDTVFDVGEMLTFNIVNCEDITCVTATLHVERLWSNS